MVPYSWYCLNLLGSASFKMVNICPRPPKSINTCFCVLYGLILWYRFNASYFASSTIPPPIKELGEIPTCPVYLATNPPFRTAFCALSRISNHISKSSRLEYGVSVGNQS